MSGDDLTIRATFLGLAVAFGLGAVTVAGWKTRWLVSGLFSVAAISLALAVFWAPIGSNLPRLRELAVTFAVNDYAFALVAVIIAGIFIFDFLARRGWLSPPEGRFKDIYNRVFEGELVDLDHCHFIDCRFKNVTYRWGGAPFAMTRAKIEGRRQFETNSIHMVYILEALQALQLLDKEFAESWHRLPPEYFRSH
jgi:hypothetical protein